MAVFVVGLPASARAQSTVTLSSPPSPAAAQPGVHTINVIGSGFPSGAIPPGNVLITLEPATLGAGATATTPAGTVAAISGTSRRVTFHIPSSIAVTVPTPYRLSLSGRTSAGIGFSSRNKASLTVNPPATIASLAPPAAAPGETVSVAITTTFTNFVQGATHAQFGPGISVGGGPEGGFGPVKVVTQTSATAKIAINPSAPAGFQRVTVKTGVQEASLDRGFSVRLPNRAPVASPGGPYAGTVGQAVAFTGTGSTDADGDPLAYDWDFGDGTTGTGATPSHTFGRAGPFTVTLTVSDGRGGSSSGTTIATISSAIVLRSIVVSPATTRFSDLVAVVPMAVTGVLSDGSTTNLTAASTGTTYESSNSFVATVDTEGLVTAVANGSTTISARNQGFSATASVTVEIGVILQALDLSPARTTLRAAGATQQLRLSGIFSDLSERDLSAAATGTSYASSDVAVAKVSADGLVTAVAAGPATITASNGDLSKEAQITVAISGGAGFLRGEVYDDSKGLPLPAVSATLLADGSGPVAPPLTTTADEHGQFLLAGRQGDAIVRLDKAGFTSVEREGVVPADTAFTLLDARLTPLDSRLTPITSALGGQAHNAASTVTLDFLPGSLETDAEIRLTEISRQGLQGRLPFGWSPITAVHVHPPGLDFGQPAILRVQNALNLAPDTEIVLTFYDPGQHRWIVRESARVTPDGLQITAVLATSGQVVLLLADAPPFAPPSPVIGQPLRGVPPVTLPSQLTATGAVVPRQAPPGEGARAVGTIVLRAPAPIPSGLHVEAHVTERYDLFDASTAIPADFTQDLVLYARPPPGEANALSASFPVTPSLSFTIFELALGMVKLDVTAPATALGGIVVGVLGGSVTSEGNTIEVPAGALSASTVVTVSTLQATQLLAPIPGGLQLLGAVELGLGGATLSAPASLTIPRPPALPDTSQVIVAQVVVDPTGARRLKIVALGEVQSGGLVALRPGSGLPLPGLVSGGQYVFLSPSTPLGFVTGTVFAPGGTGPRSLALVTTDTAPFADLTPPTGRYVVAGAVGAARITALSQATDDVASRARTIAARGEVVALDLTLSPVAPVVISVSPAAEARNVPLDTSISVTFSEPVNPTSVTVDSFRLTAGGAEVAGVIRVAPDGLSAIITPGTRLASNTRHDITLTSAVTDLAGNPLVAFGPSAFTTVDTSFQRDVTGLVTATAPDARGVVTVRGTPGVAEPGQAVSVINNTTGVIVTAAANADGSFTIAVGASTADLLTVNLRTAAGTDTTVQIASFTHPDGGVTLGELGGRVSGSTPNGPVTLDIPPGALSGRSTVKITPLSEAEARAELLRLGLDFPAGPTFGGALRIDASGAPAKSKLTLSVPVPPGLAALAAAAGRPLAEVQTTLVRVEEFQEDGETRIGFREIDSAKVIDGRLTTASPPFDGLGVGGVFSGFFILFPFPQVFTSYVNGQVFIADDPSSPRLREAPRGEPCPHPNPAIASEQMCPAAGAIVRAFSPLTSGAPLFLALTDSNGHYAVTVPVASGDTVSVTAKRSDAEAATSSERSFLVLAPIRDLVMKRRPLPSDRTPPDIRILLSAVSVPLGTPVTITLVATDNDNRPDSLAALDASIVLTTAGPGNQPPQPQRDPADRRLKTTYVPNAVGTYVFTATARDLAGNSGAARAELTVGDFVTPPGINPAPGDADDRTPPTVVDVDPPREGRGVLPEDVVTVRFSEPVDRALTLIVNGVPVLAHVSGPTGSLAGVLTLSADQTMAVFRPAGGLEPGVTYEIRVDGVRDLNGNRLDQDPLSSGPQPFVSRFQTLAAPAAVTVPGTLGFNIRSSRESTVLGNTLFFTDADNSATNGRILIYDVSNPLSPVFLNEIRTDGQPRAIAVVPDFSYLGLDGNPTFPPRQGFVGEPPLARPGTILFAVVFKLFASGLSGSFLQFYDVTDPRNPKPVGSNQQLSLASIGTKIKVAGGRAFVKLVDRPNPGLVVVDLRLTLVKATLLPVSGILAPDGSIAPRPISGGIIDSNGSGGSIRDFEGLDANGDGDFGDPGDELPDITTATDVVAGRFLSPGDLTDFDVSADGTRLFVADGLPQDFNGTVDIEPSTGLRGPFYGVGGIGPERELRADAANLLIADLGTLVPTALVDLDTPAAPRDGLDDRVLARLNTPKDDTEAPSTRVRLAEGLAFIQLVTTLENDLPVTREVSVVKDVAFVSSAFEGTVTMIDVDDPNRPERLAVIKLPEANGSQLQPVELSISGSRLFIDAAGFGTVEVGLNGAVVIDRTEPQPVVRSLDPINLDSRPADDRIQRTLAGVPGSGAFAPTGHAYGGSNTTEQTAPVDLPRLEFVRFGGSRAELATFDPTRPGDRLNAEALGKLRPVSFLNPGRLHSAPNAPAATDRGDRDDPEYVYFVRAIMPAGAAAADGTVPLTLESLNPVGAPLGDPGYAFPPTSYNSPRPGASRTERVLRLHRQIDSAFIHGTGGQRLSSLGTTYVSGPIFLTREPLRQADLAVTTAGGTGPFVLWSGAGVQASLAGAVQSSNVGAIYVPGVTDPAALRKVLAEASTVAASFAGEFVDSPEPSPRLNPSIGMGEAAGPVFLHNGEFTWEQVDLAITGRGLDYAFARRYESQSLFNGPLGRGWEFGYNMRLQEVPEELPASFRLTLVERQGGPSVVAAPRDVIFYDGTGRADLYRFQSEGADPGNQDELVADLGLDQDASVARHYTSPRGYFTALFKLPDGTFILLERDGSRYRFGVHGHLVSITDRNHNRLDFLHDEKLRLRAIVDTMGRLIRFGYFKVKGADDEPDFVDGLDVDDPGGIHDGKLARQRDFIDRVVQYEYDALNRLVRVTSPAVTACHGAGDCFPAGKTMQYDYHDVELTEIPRHSFQMATITWPRELAAGGAPRIRNTYENGRLKTQVWGDPATQTIQFSYSGAITTVTDRRGHPTEYTHDAFGHPDIVVERGASIPGAYTTRRQFRHPDGLLTLLTRHEGNTIAHRYDETNARQRSRGNLLQIVRTADSRGPGGSAGVLTTRYDDRPYEPRFNLPQSRRDPGGFLTTYEYDRGNLRKITRPTITGSQASFALIEESFTYNDFGQRETATDGEANITRYTYHAEASPDAVTQTPRLPLRPLDSPTGGYLHQMIVNDVNGLNAGIGTGPTRTAARLTTTYHYGAFAGSAPSIGYAGHVTAVVDPRGVRTESGVNERGQVSRRRIATTGSTDSAPALGHEHRTFYDANDQVTRREVEHQAGAFTVWTYPVYDLLDNVGVMEVGTGTETLTTRYEYDPNQNLARVVKPEGNVVAYTWEARDAIDGVTRGAGARGASTVRYTYDGNGNVRTITDGRVTGVTTIDYDGHDRRAAVTDRMTNRSQLRYDDNGLLRFITRQGPAAGQGAIPATSPNVLQDVEYRYDEVYRRTGIIERIIGDPALDGGADSFRTTRWDFDRNGRVIQVVDDHLHTVRQFHDGANRLIARIDHLGHQVEYVHDANGNVVQTIEREGAGGTFTSTAAYDASNRLVRATDPIGNVRRIEEYDAQDNPRRTLDAEQNVIRYEYDRVNRLLAKIEELRTGGTITTVYGWDRNGRLRTLTDGNTNTTTYSYDALDRQTRTLFADGSATQIQDYDANDNPRVSRDQNGNVLREDYDGNDRLIARAVTLARAPLAGSLDAVAETYAYDGLGRLTRAQDEDARVEQVYDSLGRVTREIQTRRDVGTVHTVQSRYDGVGNRRRLAYPSGPTIEYTYDELHRLHRVLSPVSPALDEGLATYRYTGPSRLAGRGYANGTDLAMSYALGATDRRMSRLVHVSEPPGQSRVTLFDFRYNWTAEDRRVGEQRMHEGGTADLFEYDSAFRLTRAQHDARLASGVTLDTLAQGQTPPTQNVGRARAYVYDAADNLTTATRSGTAPAPSFPDAFGAPTGRNQYQSVVEGGQARTQTYDPNGNTLVMRLERRTAANPNPSFGEAQITYDYRNQPIQVTYAGSPDRSIYRYDALGRRIEKRVEQGGVVIEETRYLLDGEREIEERDAADALQARYTYGRRLDEALAMERRDPITSAFSLRYFHENSLGTVVGLSDETGNLVERYRYDAYGTPLPEAVDRTDPHVFQVRTAAGNVEIDFTESLLPGDFDGLVLINGTPATGIDLLATVISVPTGAPGVTAPVFRATLRAPPPTPLVSGGTVTVVVVPSSGGRRLLDVAGNALAAAFTTTFTFNGIDATVFAAAGAVGTGPRQLGISEAGNPYLFQGRRYDPETGLYHYRARAYAPSLGRFLQNDPKGYGDGPNLYTAFGNNPVNRLDPFGTESNFEKDEREAEEARRRQRSPWGWCPHAITQPTAEHPRGRIIYSTHAKCSYQSVYTYYGTAPLPAPGREASIDIGPLKTRPFCFQILLSIPGGHRILPCKRPPPPRQEAVIEFEEDDEERIEVETLPTDPLEREQVVSYCDYKLRMGLETCPKHLTEGQKEFVEKKEFLDKLPGAPVGPGLGFPLLGPAVKWILKRTLGRVMDPDMEKVCNDYEKLRDPAIGEACRRARELIEEPFIRNPFGSGVPPTVNPGP